MGGSVDRRRDSGSVAEDGDLLLGVVVLEDLSDRLDSVEILVSVHVEVVEGVSVGGVAVAEGEVNRNVELDFTAAEHIFEEGVPLVEVEGLEGDCPVFAFVQSEFSLVLLELCEVAG